MEFSEKLQKLRAERGLTQEELAEKIFVSRTAISKWESGRGYPGIDSLKAVASFFGVTIDELIRGEEMVTLVEQDKKDSSQKTTALICGAVDCLTVLLFLLPVFGSGNGVALTSVALPFVTGSGSWLKVVFIVFTALTVVNGAFAVVISRLDKPTWNRHRLVTGFSLSVLDTLIFILSRQPYAGAFCFGLFLVKGFLALKRK